MTTAKNRVKVSFRDEDGDVETLWAVRLGPNRYRLENVPVFQYGVSWSDVIEAVEEGGGERGGSPFFTRVLEKSGHRTVRVLLDEEREDGDVFFTTLVRFGCTIERATPRLLAISVPPSADLRAVAQHLVVSDVDWEPTDPPLDMACEDAGEA